MMEIKETSQEDLVSMLNEKEQDLIRMRLDHGSSGIPQPLELRSLRRSIARIKTEMRSRELEAGGTTMANKRKRLRERRRRS